MRGATLKVIQELLGHSTITMTMRYAHLAPRVSREAVRMLDEDAPTNAFSPEQRQPERVP
jgi:site-specific recombinase XerD